MVTNMDHRSKWTWQWGQGPTCHAGWPHKGTTRHHPCPCHVMIHESCSTSLLKRPINVGLISGQDWKAMDPWAHCHTLGSLQPTYKPPSYLNFYMAVLVTAIEEQPRRYDQEAVDPRAAWRPRVATDLLATYKYPRHSTL